MTLWKDRIVEHPKTYTIRNNINGTVTLIPAPGKITEEGVPVNAANLNLIEQRLDAIDNEKTRAISESLERTQELPNASTGFASLSLQGITYVNRLHNADFVQGKTNWRSTTTADTDVVNPNGTYFWKPPSDILIDYGIKQDINTIPGHKYYGRFTIRAAKPVKGKVGFQNNPIVRTTDYPVNNYCVESFITTATITNDVFIMLLNGSNYTAGDVIQFRQAMLLDLTETFGAGKEPDIAFCDSLPYFIGMRSSGEVNRIEDRYVGKNLMDLSLLFKMTTQNVKSKKFEAGRAYFSKTTTNSLSTGKLPYQPFKRGYNYIGQAQYSDNGLTTSVIFYKTGSIVKIWADITQPLLLGVDYDEIEVHIITKKDSTTFTGSTWIEKLQIEEIAVGGNPTDYEEYYEGCKVEVLSRGKNLIKYEELKTKLINIPYATPINNGFRITNMYAAFTPVKLSDICVTGKQYILSYKTTFVSGNAHSAISGTIQFYNAVTDKYISLNASFIAPDDAYNYKMIFYGSSTGIYDFYDIQLEEGTVATPYEPYKEDKLNPLVQKPLGRWDKTSKNKVIYGGGKYVFDGSENWASNTDDPSISEFVTFFISDFANLKKGTDIVTNFGLGVSQINHIHRKCEGISNSSNVLYLSINKNKLTEYSVLALKEYLQKRYDEGDPIEMYYQLTIPENFSLYKTEDNSAAFMLTPMQPWENIPSTQPNTSIFHLPVIIPDAKPSSLLRGNIIPSTIISNDVNYPNMYIGPDKTLYAIIYDTRAGIIHSDSADTKVMKFKNWLSTPPYSIVSYALEKPIQVPLDLTSSLAVCAGGSIVNTTSLPASLSIDYPSSLRDSINSMAEVSRQLTEELGTVWMTLLGLADKELQMNNIQAPVDNTSDVLKAKINEILEAWK